MKPKTNTKSIYLATYNQGKIKELSALLAAEGWQVKSLHDLPAEIQPTWIEDGDTFQANALIKARSLKGLVKGNILADDSGLVVPALDGAPGVYSARWSGDQEAPDADVKNNQKLLQELSSCKTPEERQAYFVCSLAFIDEQGEEHFFEGTCHGHVPMKLQGQGGFGYDPLFIPKGHTVTLAELGSTEKNRISHRFHALQQLHAYLTS
jgi:XTP/dITP diphosphohydrolase